MTQYISEKIRLISLFAIIFVLYIHSDFHDYPHEILGMTANHYLQDFISKMIGRCAVPIFFVISGFLFFQNINHGIADVLIKIRKRIYTLLIPFIIAALVFPLCFFFANFIPKLSLYINTDILACFNDSSFFQIIYYLFVDSGTGQPIAFHLWFLRDLIIIIALTPIIYEVMEVMPKGWLSMVIFILTYVFPHIGFLTSLFWFVLGSEHLMHFSRIKSMIFPLLFLVVCVLELLFPVSGWAYFKLPIMILGVLTFWNLYDLEVSPNFHIDKRKWLAKACKYTFFIYLYHEPFLNILRKVIAAALGKTSFAFATSYLLSPWIFLVLWVCLGIASKKYAPNVYKLLVGGR